MPKTAAEFLSDLEKRGLIPAAMITSLKNQVAKSTTAVAPATVAKLLVDKGYLTAAQAQQLLGAVPATAKSPSASTAAQLSPLDDLQPLDDLSPLDEVIPLDKLDPLDSLTDLGAAPAAAADPLAAKTLAPAKQTPAARPMPAPAQPGKRKSSLGLVLGLLLLLALVGGGAVGALFLIPRGGGEHAFAAAEQDYQAKQYDAAVAKYDAYLADYPASEQAPSAQVRRAAAKVLAARAGSPQSWQPVLTAAKEALPPVGGAAELSQVHPELAPVLMDMAADLATQAAEGAATADKVAAAREALALAGDGRFVPGAQRQWQRLELAEENVARAAYEVDRSKTLDAGVASIKKAAEAGDVEAAAAERAKLLAVYPDLEGESSLRDLGPALAPAAAGKLQVDEYSAPAETTERKTGIVGTMVFSTALKKVAASETGSPAIFAAESSVWGMDSATGRVLWRRGTGGPHPPIRLAADAASDVLLVEAGSTELIRAAAQSGAIQWRHKLNGPLAASPLVVGNQVIATTKSGQIVAIDAQSGSGMLAAQLPQTARVGPMADVSSQHLVQLADHSLLYVLSAADLKCVRAVFVGHEPAAVVVAPILLPKHLVVAENRGSTTSTLHVLALDAGGLPQAVVQQIEVAGHVFAPPAVLAGHLVVATDQGRVLAYESAADPTSGLKEIAKAEAGAAAGIARYPLVNADKLLIAGQGLRLFGPPAGGAMKSAWSALGDDVLLGPPQVVADTIVTIRKLPDSAGIVAAGLNLADGKPRWETRLAEPLSSVALSADAGSITVANASGGSATLATADLSGPKVTSLAPAAAQRPGPPLGESAGSPIAWRDGSIAASPAGAISYSDAKTGSLKADPLQLRLRPGQRLENCRLAPVGSKGEQLLIADGQRTLYLVDLAGEGVQQLTELASAQLESPPISGLAVGDKVVGLVDRRGQLVTFSLPDLKTAASLNLKVDAIVAGPTRIGDSIVLATDRDGLVCLDRSLAQSWKVPLAHGPLAGDFIAEGTGLIIACKNGWLCRLAKESGQEIAAVDLGQPLDGTPLLSGGAAIVPTADGAILKVSLPAEKGAQP